MTCWLFTIRLNFVNHGNCVHRLSAGTSFRYQCSVSLRGLSVTQQKAYESWYDALSDYEQDNPYRVDACYSGDLLGGWTIPLQRSVEDELNQNDTRWRQLFSWDEEIHSTTALLAVAGPDFGGGIDYIMMTEKDMAAQCFDRVRNVVQLD